MLTIYLIINMLSKENKYKKWGIKKRCFPNNNYNAVWSNLKTIRIGEGIATELPPEFSEFYDVGINTLCNAECPWCYVSATSEGENYTDVCNTWKKWMSLYKEETRNSITYTTKPFQIALGSTGEVTLHPEFCEFLKTVYDTNVVPNYTTNGIILSYWNKPKSQYFELANKILDYTSKFCGGVAVSVGNTRIRDYAFEAISGLLEKGNCYVNIHHIIYDRNSVDDFVNIWTKYGDDIKYHVLLPLMPSGRSDKGIREGVFEYLEDQIQMNDIKNVAFGAHFVKYLKNSKIKTWLYEPESFSKNVILKEDKVIITPSSFNMNPVKVINL